MSWRTYFVIGSATIGFLAALISIAIFIPALSGELDRLQGGLIVCAVVSAGVAAFWSSRSGLSGRLGNPLGTATVVVGVADLVFGCLASIVLFFDATINFYDAKNFWLYQVPISVLSALMVVSLSICIGFLPAIVLEYIFCRTLFKSIKLAGGAS